MSLPVRDSAMAQRALRGARGLVDAAAATGTLDLGSLSMLLPLLGLASTPAEHRALFDALRLPAGAPLTGVSVLPWPGPARPVAGTLAVGGLSGLVDVALQLAAGAALGRVALKLPVQVPPDLGADALEPLLSRMGSAATPVTLVAGPPRLTVDLVSPAARDLHAVLEVAAERTGSARPAPSSDAAYELLPLLEASDAGLRDERAQADVLAGLHRTAGGAVLALPAVDPDAADPRLATCLKGGEGVLACVEMDVLPLLLPSLAPRLRSLLLLAPAALSEGVAAEIPEQVLAAADGRVLAGLLADAAIQGRDVEFPGEICVGESAVAAPGVLLAGVARRATGLGRAAVVDGVTLDALQALDAARGDGSFTGKVRCTVALYPAHAPAVARALACAFLQSNLKDSKAGGGRGQKVRIKG